MLHNVICAPGMVISVPRQLSNRFHRSVCFWMAINKKQTTFYYQTIQDLGRTLVNPVRRCQVHDIIPDRSQRSMFSISHVIVLYYIIPFQIRYSGGGFYGGMATGEPVGHVSKSQLDRQFLSCGICFNRYNNPKVNSVHVSASLYI